MKVYLVQGRNNNKGQTTLECIFFFRLAVKREIRIAEKEHVRNDIYNRNGNANSIWKL